MQLTNEPLSVVGAIVPSPALVVPLDADPLSLGSRDLAHVPHCASLEHGGGVVCF